MNRRTAARLRALLALPALLLLAACVDPNALDKPTEPLGTFRLGHNIVVARNPTVGPLSRTATEAEWQEVMTAAIDRRFGRYQGDRLYHLGISVDGYVLAFPGVPVVASPKSVLIVTVNVWDDARNLKLTDEAKQITVLEDVSGDTIIGSGLTKTKERQMADLSANVARAIERWLRDHPEWIDPPPEVLNAPPPAAN